MRPNRWQIQQLRRVPRPISIVWFALPHIQRDMMIVFEQMPRRYQAIAAVIARPNQNNDVLLIAMKHGQGMIGNAMSSLCHQASPRRPLFDAESFKVAHLLRSYEHDE